MGMSELPVPGRLFPKYSGGCCHCHSWEEGLRCSQSLSAWHHPTHPTERNLPQGASWDLAGDPKEAFLGEWTRRIQMLVSHHFPLWQHPRGMGDSLGKTWGLAGENKGGGKEAEKGETSALPGNELRQGGTEAAGETQSCCSGLGRVVQEIRIRSEEPRLDQHLPQ